MNLHELKALIAEFGGFDGAVVQSLAFHIGASVEDRQVSLVVRAFHSPHGENEGHWKDVSLLASDHAVFGWVECSRVSNLVVNWPVEVILDGELLIIDFDPLHPATSLRGIKLSAFFIGGRGFSVSVSPVLNGLHPVRS